VEARAIIDLCGPGEFRQVTEAFVKRQIQKDPQDAAFLLYEVMLQSPWEFESESTRQRLEEILRLARNRGDTETIQRIQSMLKSLEQPSRVSEPPQAEDWEEESEESDFEMPPSGPGFPFEGMPKEIGPELELLLAELRRASPSQVQALRESVANDIPPVIFDCLLDMARKGAKGLPILPPGPRNARKARHDPRQDELF
jgi:hypothetical protein